MGYNFIFFLFPSLKIDVDSANSADPDEMPYYAAFHLGLGCLPKYLLLGFLVFKGLKHTSCFTN